MFRIRLLGRPMIVVALAIVVVMEMLVAVDRAANDFQAVMMACVRCENMQSLSDKRNPTVWNEEKKRQKLAGRIFHGKNGRAIPGSISIKRPFYAGRKDPASVQPELTFLLFSSRLVRKGTLAS